MRIVKWLFTALLSMLLLGDAIVAFRLIRYGWPKRLVGTVVDGTAQTWAVPIPMDTMAWVSFGLYLGAHGALCYGLWRVCRRSAVQPPVA